jgi:hypothetical protein
MDLLNHALDALLRWPVTQARLAGSRRIHRRRFAEKRLDGLLDEPRPGRPREIGDDEIAETVRLTLETTPKDATHWSLRPMAEAVDHAPSTIHRIWRALASL